MGTESTIPVPVNSGNQGIQVLEDTSLKRIPDRPMEGLTMAKTINGLTSSHSKQFGGEVAAALIAGATNQITFDYRELKSKHDDLNRKFDSQRDLLEKTRTENAVFVERIRSERQNKHIRNFAIAMGTGLIGTGLKFSQTELDVYAFGAFVVGAIFLYLGWFTHLKEEK